MNLKVTFPAVLILFAGLSAVAQIPDRIYRKTVF